MLKRAVFAATAALTLLTVGHSLAQAPPAAQPAPPAAPARPPFETTKVDGTDNVYIFRNGNHQSMFIVTKAGVIATDPIAYGRPTGGQTYVDEIKKVTKQPIKYLIYSHHHYDHIAGGKAFKDAGATSSRTSGRRSGSP
jgi:glyoxylase-like metal-dependent hydrolase (beta-lactamase superfamily II)